MKKLIVTMALLSFALVGCSQKDDQGHSSHTEGTLEEVKVEILTKKELPVGDKVELAAKVTQGKENVDDADEVKFEVWESGMRETGQMLDGKIDKDGVYKVDFTFDHDGVYYMQAHTTARGLHVMPKEEIKVGSPDLSKVKEDKSDDKTGMDKMNSHENHK